MGVEHTSLADTVFTGKNIFKPVAKGNGLYLCTTFEEQSTYFVNTLLVAVSSDGINFDYLQVPNSYDPASGSLRDPNWIKVGNTYWIAYTNNATMTTQSFGLAKSTDLQTWEFVDDIDVSSIGSVDQVWSPSWFQESGTNDYTGLHLIIDVSTASTTGPFALYETHPLNAAMTSWSAPVLITGTLPSNMIDGKIYQKPGDANFYLWFKDETTTYIGYAVSSSLTSGYAVVQSGNWAGWGNQIEGTSLFLIDETTWRIYFEGYGAGTMWYSESTDGWATWTAKAEAFSPWPMKSPTIKLVSDINTIYNIIGALIGAKGRILNTFEGCLTIGNPRGGLGGFDYLDINNNGSGGFIFRYDTHNAIFWDFFDTGQDLYLARKNGVASIHFPGGSDDAEFFGFPITMAGKTLKITSGANAKAGTFTLVAGAATVMNTSVTANSVILVTLKTLGGTRAGLPDIVPTASTGFTATAVVTDTSVYNYVILEVG